MGAIAIGPCEGTQTVLELEEKLLKLLPGSLFEEESGVGGSEKGERASEDRRGNLN